MQVSTLWKQHVERHEASGLNDLRRQSILQLGMVMLVMAWLIMLGSIGYGGEPQGLLVAGLLLAGAVGIIFLRREHFHLALGLFIASSLAAVVVQSWLFPESSGQYFLPLVVVACGMLFSSGWSVFVVATLCALACLTVDRFQGVEWFDYNRVLLPIFLTYITAITTWLGSRQMHMALAWTQNSYVQANDLLTQLRDERMHLASTLKMLDEAYYRITRLNHALIEARSVAETARRLKAEFAANISHELRTPLNLIIGFSETMANAPETYRNVTWSPILRGDVDQIYRSSRHLSALIDDILDLSALEAQQLGLTLQEGSIAGVVQEAADVVRDLYRAKRLYLNLDVPPDLPRLRMDITRIRQVLLNLLSNAIRFTREGGVTIEASLVGSDIQISVIDTGIGIAAADMNRVFEEFGQVDGALNRVQEGTGLGVPLSKRLIELHGGRLWLESKPGSGTTFYFAIPVTSDSWRPPANIDSSQLNARPQAHTTSGRDALVVVEPDPLLLRTIRRHMSGYDVIEIKNGDEIAKVIEDYQPVALLMDSQDVAGKVEEPAWALAAPATMPIITVSIPGSVKSARALGVPNYLIKPVSREQLLDAIDELGRTIQTILIVDDDPRLVELLSRMLQSGGLDYRLLKAHSGSEALDLMRQHKPDLVLLDMVMPALGGIDVLHTMKQDTALVGIPVIIISAQPPEDAGPDIGLFLHVTRPAKTSITEVLGCLKALIEGLPRPEPTRPEASAELPVVQADLPVS
jgi:signal transduction histidine kinase/CheY-like chemotaxis protein